MRRDGSSAANVQPKHPVAERGRVHGVPGFSSYEVLRIAAKREVVLSSEKDKRRWRKRARDPDRLRGLDKAAFLDFTVEIVKRTEAGGIMKIGKILACAAVLVTMALKGAKIEAAPLNGTFPLSVPPAADPIEGLSGAYVPRQPFARDRGALDRAATVILATGKKPNASATTKPSTAGDNADVYAPLTQLQGHLLGGSFTLRNGGRSPASLALGNALLSLAVAKALRDRPNELPDAETTALLVDHFLGKGQLRELLDGVGHVSGVDVQTLMETPAESGTIIRLILQRGDQFIRTEIIQRFAERYIPIIAAAAPKLPIDIVVVEDFQPGDYDFERAGYDIRGQTITFLSGRVNIEDFGGAAKLVTFNQQFVPVPQELARRAAPQMKDFAAIAAFARINGISFNLSRSGEIANKPLYRLHRRGLLIETAIKRVGLFADRTLATELGPIAVPEANPDITPIGMSDTPRALLTIRQTPARAAAPIESALPQRTDANAPNASSRPKTAVDNLKFSAANEFPIRYGDFMVMPIDSAAFSVYRSAAWNLSHRSDSALDMETDRIEAAHENAAVQIFSRLAYGDWAASHPNELTPLSLAGHLSNFLLSQQQVNALYRGLADRQFQPVKAPNLGSRSVLSSRINALDRLDPKSQMEFRRRFDAAHRVGLAAIPPNRKLVLIRLHGLPHYDFQRQAFQLTSRTASGGGTSPQRINEELSPLLPGMFWGSVQASYSLPEFPELLEMPLDRAKALSQTTLGRGVGPELFEARFAEVAASKISFANGKVRFDIDLQIERRALYVENSLKTKILSVAPEPHVPAPAAAAIEPDTTRPPPAKAAGQENKPAQPSAAEARAGSNIGGEEPVVAAGAPAAEMAPSTAKPVPQQPAPQKPRLAATSAPDALQQEQSQRLQAFKPDRIYDIAGLNLYMTATEARNKIKDKLGFKRSLSLSSGINNQIVSFSSAQIFVRDDGMEYIALITQPDRSGDRLIAIGRYVYEGLGVFKKDDFIRALQDKYGQSRNSSAPFMYWGGLPGVGPANGPCFVQLGRVGGNISWIDNATGRYPNWSELLPRSAPQGFVGPQGMPWIGFTVTDLQRAGEFKPCGPVVAVWLPELAGQIPEYAVWLTDTGAYMGILANSMKAGGSSKPRL
ncbi:hypothetical protein [Nitrobacter winogradskyi]|nr:hypothetical protein [Nitrobacter winogradskyi]